MGAKLEWGDEIFEVLEAADKDGYEVVRQVPHEELVAA